jgi:hypothetical protein
VEWEAMSRMRREGEGGGKKERLGRKEKRWKRIRGMRREEKG